MRRYADGLDGIVEKHYYCSMSYHSAADRWVATLRSLDSQNLIRLFVSGIASNASQVASTLRASDSSLRLAGLLVYPRSHIELKIETRHPWSRCHGYLSLLSRVGQCLSELIGGCIASPGQRMKSVCLDATKRGYGPVCDAKDGLRGSSACFGSLSHTLAHAQRRGLTVVDEINKPRGRESHIHEPDQVRGRMQTLCRELLT